MTEEHRKSPDELDSEDLIRKAKDLSAAINNPLCTVHTDMLVWIMRRMDLSRKDAWMVALANLPWPVTVVLGVLYLVGLGFGWVPAPFK
jgi:hypothetical protein